LGSKYFAHDLLTLRTVANPPQHTDAGFHGFARLGLDVYFAIVNGRVARRG
jgi:hypothetical protein